MDVKSKIAAVPNSTGLMLAADCAKESSENAGSLLGREMIS
jgi:hypothetical protein